MLDSDPIAAIVAVTFFLVAMGLALWILDR
jgi:hypothetical protein